MTGSKCNPEADMRSGSHSPAREFLADRGIDCATPSHREDAARFMAEFAKLERKFSEQIRVARKGMKDRHDALRKLADS